MADSKTHDLFLSHDWGEKCSNHIRVARINEELKKRNFTTWMDTDGGMVDQLNDDMARGIEQARVGMVFVTAAYRDKVNGYTPRGTNDNCYREFSHMIMQLTAAKMIAVVLDPDVTNPVDWKGSLGLNMASKMYLNMSGDLNDLEYMDVCMYELEQRIRKMLEPADVASKPVPVSSAPPLAPKSAPAKDKEGNTILHKAVLDNEVNEVKNIVVDFPSIIDERNSKEMTALNMAVHHGRLPICKLLVVNGADVDAANDTETTPLLAAAFYNRPRIVEYLLQEGADPNIPNCDNWTPLDCAHNSGHCDCGQLIKKAGGTANVHELCKCKKCKRAPAQRQYIDDDGNTALHRAVLNNDVNEVRQMLKEFPNLIDERNYQEATALNIAARHGRLPIVKLLLAGGADKNAPNDTETTALFCATFGRHPRVVEHLLEEGADANLANCDNWTPLDMANQAGHKECAAFIKKFGGISNVNHELK